MNENSFTSDSLAWLLKRNFPLLNCFLFRFVCSFLFGLFIQSKWHHLTINRAYFSFYSTFNGSVILYRKYLIFLCLFLVYKFRLAWHIMPNLMQWPVNGEASWHFLLRNYTIIFVFNLILCQQLNVFLSINCNWHELCVCVCVYAPVYTFSFPSINFRFTVVG